MADRPSSRDKFRVPYGDTHLEFALPAGLRATVAEPRPAAPLDDPGGAVADALAHPVGSPPLRELAGRGQRVCIVFTDSTRACPDNLLVPAMLGELEQAGIQDDDITLLCATGLHRPSTSEEKAAKLGARIAARYRVIDNSPQDLADLADLGVTSRGVPVQIHRAAVEADLLIATGVVEPHQFAGYSGGPKALAIGAAGEALIAYTHGPAFLDHPRTRLGSIDGNPFQEAVAEAARRARLRCILNVVLDDEKRLLQVRAGDPTHAFRELVSIARSIYEVPIPHRWISPLAAPAFPKTPISIRPPGPHRISRSPRRRWFGRVGFSSFPRAARKAPEPALGSSASWRPCGTHPMCGRFWRAHGITGIRRGSSGPSSWPRFWNERES